MDRLTDHLVGPPETFLRCQLCGKTHDDICMLVMWRECDEHDQPEDRWLITCSNGECRKRIQKHPRLYIMVPWAAGGPGRFQLLCGNCPHREGWECKHPSLKANGGEGLEVKFSNPLGTGWICGDDGCRRIEDIMGPATSCEGNPDGRDRLHEQEIALRGGQE